MTYRLRLSDGRVLSSNSEEYREHMAAKVADWPALNAEQKAKLSVLLAPMRARMRELAEARIDAELAAGRTMAELCAEAGLGADPAEARVADHRVEGRGRR